MTRMLVLRSAPPSPFGRKVRIAAAVVGLADRIRVEDVDTRAPPPSFWVENPLGKIPVLVLEDGSTLYDSPVILDYLDHLAGGGRLVPTAPAERFAVLKLQALADGMMEAGLAQVYEARFRPEARRHPEWVAWQAAKAARSLEALEKDPPADPARADAGRIALACALGYLDLRFDGRWRADHPALVAWLDAFAAAVPAFAATRPPG
jgi:glutathione S-transferase